MAMEQNVVTAIKLSRSEASQSPHVVVLLEQAFHTAPHAPQMQDLPRG